MDGIVSFSLTIWAVHPGDLFLIIKCPHCDKQYQVPEEKLGIKFRCSGCKQVVDTKLPDVPSVDENTPAASPPAEDLTRKEHYVLSPKGVSCRVLDSH